MNRQAFPDYFVRDHNDQLRAYFTLEILLIDLRKQAPPSGIYERSKGGFTVRYLPVTESQLRERAQRERAS